MKFFKLSTFVRYIIVAVAAYFVDMGGYIVLISLGFTPIVANISVKIVAAIFGFFAHRLFTYQIFDSQNIFDHAIKYFGLALLYIPVSSLFLSGAISLIHDPILSKFICDIVLFILVYWITSKVTFLRS